MDDAAVFPRYGSRYGVRPLLPVCPMRFAIPLQSPDTAARWTLRAVCLAALALPLSFSGGAIALPAIARDLGGSPAALNWVTNAFMLAFGSLLMAAGMLADRYGRRRVFLAGAAGFALASIGVCAAPGIVVLDLLRAAQGVAAAMALAGGSAALAQAFAGQARTRAFGLLGATFGAGLALGPLLAGLLVERIGWRAVFAIGALLGMLACGLACRAMAESHGERGAAPDWPGAATLTASLSLLTLTLIEAPRAGWLAGSTLACAGASAACGALFVWIERRCRHPMLDLSLFRYPRFVGVQLLPIATCYGFVVLLVLLPLHLVGILGLPEIQAGGLMLALSGPMLLVPLLAARLAARWPAGRACARSAWAWRRSGWPGWRRAWRGRRCSWSRRCC
jgi:MFS family permease